MAVGDEAVAAGYAIVPGTGEEGKVKYGAREINRTRDYVAQVKALILSIWPVSRGGTGSSTATGARANLGLGSVATENTVPVAKGGTGSTTASAARTALGLGTVATDSTVPVTRGGTGGTTKATARSGIGITSGTASPSGGSDGDIYFKTV
jgi:hypothetical protein